MRYFNPGWIIRPPIRTTWNVQDKSASLDLTNGNKTATSNANSNGLVRATISRSAGKWYFELLGALTSSGSAGALCTQLVTADAIVNQDANTQATWVSKLGLIINHGVTIIADGNWALSILRCAYDGTGHLVWWDATGGTRWNGSGTANPATGVGGLDVSTFDSVGLFPAFSSRVTGDAATINAGATSFTYSIPAGFTKWNG